MQRLRAAARTSVKDDLAIATGGKVLREEKCKDLKKKLSIFGSCEKVIVSQNDAIILKGADEPKHINERMEQIRETIEFSSLDDKEKLEERLAKLSHGIVFLKIGTAGDQVKIAEMKEKVRVALIATKAAAEEGFLPGGGAAFLHASKNLDELPRANIGQGIGVQIIQKALQVPLSVIASNAGGKGDDLVSQLLCEENTNFGYDASRGECVDMVKASIIDPLKSLRMAFVGAATVSSFLATVEAVVVEQGVDDVVDGKINIERPDELRGIKTLLEWLQAFNL